MASKTAVIKIIAGASVGFSLFFLTSHPNSHLKKKLPQKQFKNLSFSPNIRYIKEEKIYHFHHWLVLTICYIPLLTSKMLRKSHVFHAVFLGSILQGLLYKDRFKFTYTSI